MEPVDSDEDTSILLEEGAGLGDIEARLEEIDPDDDGMDDNMSEDDSLIQDAVNTKNISGSFKYPRHTPTEELSCIPDMPGGLPRVGQLYVCCTGEARDDDGGLQRDQIGWTVGPCWPMLCVTYSLIIGISGMVYINYCPNLPIIFWFAGIALTTTVVVALTKTACSNPGVLPRVTEAPDDTWRWSENAQSYYPPGATYCRESQVIVTDYDHFCPWTGTTIAGGNIGWFGCFVSSLGVLCVFVMFVAIGGSAVAASEYGKTMTSAKP
eukprot:g8228.t1